MDNENLNMLQSLLDSSSDFMVSLSPDHEVIAHNQAAIRFLLLYFDEPLTIGADYRNFVVKDSMRTYMNAFRKAQTGETVIIEHRTASEKAIHWFEYKMSPIYDSRRKLVAITLLARNIDLEKIAEVETKYLTDTFEAIVQNSTEAIAFLDFEGKVMQYNNKAKERLFLNFGRKIQIGDNFRDFVYPELLQNFDADFEDTLKGNFCEKEYKTQNSNEENVWIRVRMYPVCQSGKIVGATLFVLDILEQKKIEAINQVQFEKLKEISWHHSHILRSPVAKILGITGALKENPDLNAEQKEQWLNLLYQCTEELDDIIRAVVNKAYLDS